ncbi:hypothetical protein [Devosia chinhatensis]|uniref:hypothetical protein n=1 Tax=Devosia chinhatensis TaxID=429727 RepID=UPI001364D68B|nr:hypothetical protein [Devosia chinhatensis]
MAHIDLDDSSTLETARLLARRSAHAHHARLMLAAAGLATLGIVSVAGTLLITVF